MTPEEELVFWKHVRTRRMTGEHQREGQALMNALAACAPILAEMIVGTSVDPFHDDTRIPAFLTALGL